MNEDEAQELDLRRQAQIANQVKIITRLREENELLQAENDRLKAELLQAENDRLKAELRGER